MQQTSEVHEYDEERLQRKSAPFELPDICRNTTERDMAAGPKTASHIQNPYLVRTFMEIMDT